MLISILLFILGLLCLIYGGNWFVEGAVKLAKKLNLSEFIIGATIVSIGTTLPEVTVSAKAALIGNGSIAYGNAIGSIICNAALICGIVLLVKPHEIDIKKFKAPIIFFIISAVIYSIIAYFYEFTRLVGILLLSIYVLYIIYTIITTNSSKVETIENTDKWLNLLIFGIGCVVLGANLVVNNGTIIAQYLNVSDSVIGLTIVAIGTSLPEFTTAIISLRKGHGSLSLGNIIGANLFNIIFVSGVAITINPFQVPVDKIILGMNASLLIDIPVMFIVMGILLIPPLINKKLNRWQGISLLGMYTIYFLFQYLY